MPRDWLFALLLFVGMSLGAWFTIQQQRAYQKELNRVLRTSAGDELMMVSGRGRSFKGGAIAILVVNVATGRIVRASAMSGLTVFARFHDMPELVGPMDDATGRVKRKRLRDAISMALAQVKLPPSSELPHAMSMTMASTSNVITASSARRVVHRHPRYVSGADLVRPAP
ncbi:transcriptional regulator GutM [Acidipropionibacterium timonense]|uniref:transcriptional regulator GutM n=1 Tax=Acidipropionibacterium timonense TaxID=2161818 RepID=UPI00102F35DF|nr:transcriptional regulator GutM [Acidipropionibacterium timonense]